MDLACEAVDSRGQLLRILPPVTEAAIICVTRAEPAVVEHHALYADLHRAVGELEKCLLVNLEVLGLPAVEDHRALAPGPALGNDALLYDRMKAPAHPR